MRHSWLFILLFIIIIGVIFGAFANPFVNSNQNQIPQAQTLPTSQPTNHTASFAIFTNGVFRVFTAPMYHNLSPEVFIENPSPNIIYVKKSNVTYNDFFNTLPFKLTRECITTGTGEKYCTGEKNKLRFFINGAENPNALDLIIQPNDRLLITFGNLTDAQIKSQEAKIPKNN